MGEEKKRTEVIRKEEEVAFLRGVALELFVIRYWVDAASPTPITHH
jgi:hypothetical protein